MANAKNILPLKNTFAPCTNSALRAACVSGCSGHTVFLSVSAI